MYTNISSAPRSFSNECMVVSATPKLVVLVQTTTKLLLNDQDMILCCGVSKPPICTSIYSVKCCPSMSMVSYDRQVIGLIIEVAH